MIHHRRLSVGLQPEKNLLTHLKHHVSAKLVGLLFHAVLCLSQLCLKHLCMLFTLNQQLFYRGIRRTRRVGWRRNNPKIGLITIQGSERRTTQCRVERRIVPKLRKPSFPVGWRMIDSTSQIHFQTLVHPFGLAVGLWVVCSAVKQFGAQLSE